MKIYLIYRYRPGDHSIPKLIDATFSQVIAINIVRLEPDLAAYARLYKEHEATTHDLLSLQAQLPHASAWEEAIV